MNNWMVSFLYENENVVTFRKSINDAKLKKVYFN